jgi:hypothetical protein
MTNVAQVYHLFGYTQQVQVGYIFYQVPLFFKINIF